MIYLEPKIVHGIQSINIELNNIRIKKVVYLEKRDVN